MTTKKSANRSKIRLVKADEQMTEIMPDDTIATLAAPAVDFAVQDLRAHFKELTQVQARLKFLLGELEQLI